jgi:hypothetical protein
MSVRYLGLCQMLPGRLLTLTCTTAFDPEGPVATVCFVALETATVG